VLKRKWQILGYNVVSSGANQSRSFMGFNEIALAKKRHTMTRMPKIYMIFRSDTKISQGRFDIGCL